MARLKSNDTRFSRLVPFGLLGHIQPRHYRELLGVLWENKDQLPYTWKILKHGVCDGCSLGSDGLKDNVHDGTHLCMPRLKRLRQSTMAALDTMVMSDVEALRRFKPQQLRNLGRLPIPMIRRKGDRGFDRISWDDAITTIQKSIRNTTPHEMAYCATSQRLTNEVYYVFQKLARVLGTNNIDLCSRPGHAANTSGLKATLGVGAPTCSFADFIGTDLLVVFGPDLADSQPMTTQYLQSAKKAGTRMVLVSSIKQYGLEANWAAPVTRRSLFGSQLQEEFYQVRVGGEIAFINGVLKSLIASDRIDKSYVDKHTEGFAQLKAALEQQSWDMLAQRAGISRGEMQRFADIYGNAQRAVIVYSMGLLEQERGGDNVRAIVNLALARGMLGREKCGIMPIRGESGAPGGDECGSRPDKFPGGFTANEESAWRFSNLWHHPVPSNPGLSLPQMLEAAHRGKIKFLYSIGADLLESTDNPEFASTAMRKVPLRVHQDIFLNTSMLLDADQAVILLPAQTRYEQRSGGTSTSSERRIRFTPEIPGHAIGESRPEWEIPVLIGRKCMPNGDKLFPFDVTQSIREEMAKVMPIYQGIEKLKKEGDQFQWGGPVLFKDGFTSMPRQRALFTVLDPPLDRRADQELRPIR